MTKNVVWAYCRVCKTDTPQTKTETVQYVQYKCNRCRTQGEKVIKYDK